MIEASLRLWSEPDHCFEQWFGSPGHASGAAIMRPDGLAVKPPQMNLLAVYGFGHKAKRR
jgi:hypothetical protein